MNADDLVEAIVSAIAHQCTIEITLRVQPPGDPRPERAAETDGTHFADVVADSPTADPRGSLVHDTSSSFALLRSAGVNGQAIARLAAEHSPERIRQVLAAMHRRGTDVRNPAGLLRRALDNGWYAHTGNGRKP
jgi:hypothetical protein